MEICPASKPVQYISKNVLGRVCDGGCVAVECGGHEPEKAGCAPVLGATFDAARMSFVFFRGRAGNRSGGWDCEKKATEMLDRGEWGVTRCAGFVWTIG